MSVLLGALPYEWRNNGPQRPHNTLLPLENDLVAMPINWDTEDGFSAVAVMWKWSIIRHNAIILTSHLTASTQIKVKNDRNSLTE